MNETVKVLLMLAPLALIAFIVLKADRDNKKQRH